METILVFRVSNLPLRRNLRIPKRDLTRLNMKEKITAKATEMFLRLGFKSVTMDDIAGEMCISKKTIYKFFCNKELLIEEGTSRVHKEIRRKIEEIQQKGYNAIEENFVIKRMFSEMFKSADTSPVYQLKKHYPEIFAKLSGMQWEQCQEMFGKNINKGIAEGLYREDVNVDAYVQFYYVLIFSINENNQFERDIEVLEKQALEYHMRALATEKGREELQKHLYNPNI